MTLTVAEHLQGYNGTQTPCFPVLNEAGVCVAMLTRTPGRAYPVSLDANDFNVTKALAAAGKNGLGVWRTMDAAKADLASLTV